MEIKQAYMITGTRCERCGSEGPFLLDPEDDFAFREDGTIYFPEDQWGLNIDCKCPACGFFGDLGCFYEWVEVRGEEREKDMGELKEALAPLVARFRMERRRLFEDALMRSGDLFPESTVVDLLVEAMQWAERSDRPFDELLGKAAETHQKEASQGPEGAAEAAPACPLGPDGTA